MGIHNNSKSSDPYRKKENWQNGTCNFWHNNPMYSQKTKDKMDESISKLETYSNGIIKFKTK